jgi:hypothetical protein
MNITKTPYSNGRLSAREWPIAWAGPINWHDIASFRISSYF